MRRLVVPITLVLFSALTGCASQRAAHKAPADPPPPKQLKLEPVKVVANAPDTPDALEFYDAETLFKRGQEFLEGRYYTDARTYFQKLLDEFPESSYAHDAHYNLGIALLESGDAANALSHFDAYLATEQDDKNILDATFKRGASLSMMGRYQDVVTLFDTMLRERDLDTHDRMEALVDAGIGHYMTGDHATAEHRFQEAVKIHKSAEKEGRVENSYFYAQSLFYLAEIERVEYSAYKLKLPTAGKNVQEQMADQLEAKCERLLRAQYKFLQVIRTGHAGWASASGYKVGQLYEELHDDMVKLPVPPELTPDQADLYRRELRKKVAILVRKAIKTYETTINMARRTGADNVWVGKTEQSLQRMQDLLKETDDLERDDARLSG